MHVALKGAAAPAVWAAAWPHEILTGECPFQELALSLTLSVLGRRGGQYSKGEEEEEGEERQH